MSATLHVMVIVLAVFGLPSMFAPDPAPDQTVVVEVVDLAETRPAETPKPKPKPPKQETKAPPPPPPAPKEEVAPPAPPEPEQVAKAEPPPKPKPKPKPVPKPKPKPEPQAAPEPKPPPRAKPEPVKEVPKPRRKPRQPDPLKSLLRDLNKQKQQEQQRRREEEKQLADVLAAAAPVPQPEKEMSPIDRRRAAATLAHLVMRQVSPCWIIPAGAKDAHTIRVGVQIFLNPDGTLSGPPKVEDQARMARDPAFRAVAESALRALRNPRCSPLRLPIRDYAAWREITFNFDPRELLR